ncbi:peroxisome biogenesis protein 2 isoform X2 [Cryptomeria japonica]|uniref:peroxisome biogenesis protein 2 isoform X2 n=1 Tax=Cryptomeria japonica TaxID=3369 RepID=UPI0027DA3DAE|nr:peroxisome biogenesis protein 2 isoform X2 [Cryptomeria japonica]XP_057867145.2 peroxisome biogenesis protein 2 isoform X2 [Cryptomeria japonica]
MAMEDTLPPSSSTLQGNNVPSSDAWRQAYLRVASQWHQIKQSRRPIFQIPISRVNQLDAGKLDVEISAMLKEQLVKVFSVMKPGWLFRYEPELDAFLQFLIWRFSIWVDKPTPGNALMNLRYRDEGSTMVVPKEEVRTGLEGPGLTRSQKLWYCLATIGGQYGWTRLQSFSAYRSWGDSEHRSWTRRAWVLLQRAESFYQAALFINLLIFLYTGRYRNIVERILRARLVYERPNMNRSVSFEYMNRQLVWNEFSELLLLMLPLLNTTSIKKILFFPFAKDKSDGNSLEDDACPVCGANPILISFIAVPCEHKYCYYCLRTRCASTSSFHCLKCNAQVVAMKRNNIRLNTIGGN